MTLTKTHTGLQRMVRFLKRVDLVTMRLVRRPESKTLTLLMRIFTKVGDPTGWTTLSLCLMVWEGSATGLGLHIGLVSLFAALVAKAMKHAFKRTRPCLHESFPKALAPAPDRWSFPSGHTTSAFAVAIFLLCTGVTAGPLFTGLAVGVALSRVYLGVHFPSDVLGGACLGILVGLNLFPLANFVMG